MNEKVSIFSSVVTPCNNNFDQMPNDLAESQYTALTSNLMSAPEGKAKSEILKGEFYLVWTCFIASQGFCCFLKSQQKSNFQTCSL